MAVAVNMPREGKKRRDPLETILTGLKIAGDIYGIKDAQEKSALLAENAKFDRAAKEAELADKGFDKQVGEDGSVSFAKRDGFQNLQDQKTAAEIAKANAETNWIKSGKGGAGGVGGDQDIRDLKKMVLQKQAQDAIAGKSIPANDAVAMGGSDAAFKALDVSRAMFKNNQDISGPIQGRISGLMGKLELGETGRNAKVYDAQLKANAQIIGKYLEGGKLTDSDIDRYMDILPNKYDSPEVADQKATVLQNLIAQKQASEVESLAAAGYNTGNLKSLPSQPNPNIRVGGGDGGSAGLREARAATSGAAASHPQDSEALKWARANPKDPRAQAIIKLNGR